MKANYNIFYIFTFIPSFFSLILFSSCGGNPDYFSFDSEWKHIYDAEYLTVSEEYDLYDQEFLYEKNLVYPRMEEVLSAYEKTIKINSEKYGVDWRLILAVMNQESSFRIRAVSGSGAYGLMQIMPRTGREISMDLGIECVQTPENNIVGGIYYLWQMRGLFTPDNNDLINTSGSEEDFIKLALAAYNGGPSRVFDAQDIARYLGMDPYRWADIRDIMPMLERRYYTLHRQVWESGRPSGNYFHGWPETINYVAKVNEYYLYYKELIQES